MSDCMQRNHLFSKGALPAGLLSPQRCQNVPLSVVTRRVPSRLGPSLLSCRSSPRRSVDVRQFAILINITSTSNTLLNLPPPAAEAESFRQAGKRKRWFHRHPRWSLDTSTSLNPDGQ